MDERECVFFALTSSFPFHACPPPPPLTSSSNRVALHTTDSLLRLLVRQRITRADPGGTLEQNLSLGGQAGGGRERRERGKGKGED